MLASIEDGRLLISGTGQGVCDVVVTREQLFFMGSMSGSRRGVGRGSVAKPMDIRFADGFFLTGITL